MSHADLCALFDLTDEAAADLHALRDAVSGRLSHAANELAGAVDTSTCAKWLNDVLAMRFGERLDVHPTAAAALAHKARAVLDRLMTDALPPDRHEGVRSALQKALDVDTTARWQAFGVDRRLLTLGQVAAGLAHELRNPLAVIESSAFLMRQRVHDNVTVEKHLDKIAIEVQRAGALITSLLTLARSGPLQKTIVALMPLIERARAEAHLPGSVVVTTTVPDTLTINADDQQLCSVVCNLLANAAGAHHVAVTAGEDAACTWLRVHDDGAGVPAHLRTRIFDPLFTTKAAGHGIGLSLARLIAEAHGGTLTLEDTEAGASFLLRVPR